jgi:tRNA A-37 threonylcarbamoyl transferase component Bud32
MWPSFPDYAPKTPCRSIGEPGVVRHEWTRRLLHVPGLASDLIERLWNEPDALIAEGQCLKDGGRCTVARYADSATPVVVKRFNNRSFKHRVTRSVLPSRGWRNWQGGHCLLAARVPVPQPLAFMETRWGPLRGRSFVVLEWLECKSLFDWLGEQQRTSDEIDAAARQMAQLQRAMAEARLTHGDLRPLNTVWHQGRLWLLDLDAVRWHRHDSSLNSDVTQDTERFLAEIARWPHWQTIFRQHLLPHWPMAPH